MTNERFAEEVGRARRAYDAYTREGCYETVWAPFDEAEAQYRSQQALAFARLMRCEGFMDLAGLRILDVGCGRGRQLRAFLDMGASPDNLDGIDIHGPSLEIARSLAPALRFGEFNGWDIPFEDATFDLVAQFVVFSSIALPELRQHLAAEMLRVLRPGGYVFWWDTLALSWRTGRAGEKLRPDGLFDGLMSRGQYLGRRPTVGECVRAPEGLRPYVRRVLDRLPLSDRPTHLAALVGPKR